MLKKLYDGLIKRQEKLAVVGLGYVGLPLAIAFAKHLDVIGYDRKSFSGFSGTCCLDGCVECQQIGL